MVTQLIDPTHLDHTLCTLSALYNPLEPLLSNINAYNYANSTQIFMKLET